MPFAQVDASLRGGERGAGKGSRERGAEWSRRGIQLERQTSTAMSQDPIRVRFAPSPTGYLHVGGARTALFNWLFARQAGGKFLLRIEDTDRQRSSEEHTQVIRDGLTWIGLDWDEDIVFQGEGLERHQALADELLTKGDAYVDDGAVRFRMPHHEIAWEDAVGGHISFHGADIQDWVILRSDRTPTYNFTVVADDLSMQISHVIRGADHISNTPKQIAVFEALGHTPPVFAHVPMIHGPDGRKLSKRHGATAVGDYKKLGILPEALRNFLALLGWNPKDERELFFKIDDLIQAFSLADVQRKSAIFDITKLEWMNGQYLSRTAVEELMHLVEPEMRRLGFDPRSVPRAQLVRAVDVNRERARTTMDVAERAAVRLDSRFIKRDDEKATKLIAKDPQEFYSSLEATRNLLAGLDDSAWRPERLERELRSLADSLGLGPGKIFQPIRVAITGTTVSEGIHILLDVVGRAESLARIDAVLRMRQQQSG
ncbi:MAG: glutamate--tRNA ligase [Gemmatimonadota bacterium]|nr:MAG: glutamate--tRNA ligase [Gemmatimonadota bacterium]